MAEINDLLYQLRLADQSTTQLFEKRLGISLTRYQILQYFLVNEELETLYFAIYSDVMAAAPALELQIFEIKREDIEDEIETARKMQEATLAIVEREVEKLTF